MWVERVVRRGFDPTRDAGGRAVDVLDLNWDECRRVVKGATRGGEPVRVLLPVGETVRHGDVLLEDDAAVVVIQVRPSEVIVAKPTTLADAAALALQLGNLHHPTQIVEGELVFVAEAAVIAYLAARGMAWRTEQRVFEPSVMDLGTPQVASGFEVVRPSR